jgi:sulfite reductase beta subunit-like hemoprotein
VDAQARLKYLVHEWGVPKFRSVVEQYYGKAMQPFRCAEVPWNSCPSIDPPSWFGNCSRLITAFVCSPVLLSWLCPVDIEDCSLSHSILHAHERRPLPAWEFRDYMGWMEQGDGRLAYGVFVANGRLQGELKTALRRVIERYELPVRITANQSLILADIVPSWKADIITTLQAAGVRCAPAFPPTFSIRACMSCMCNCPSFPGSSRWQLPATLRASPD